MARAPDPFEREMMAALPKLQRVAAFLTRDAERAADLVQDTLERALRNREHYVLGSNMGAWLAMICRNHFYSECRRGWRSVTMPVNESGTPLADLVLTTPASQQHKLELDDLLEAISYLPFQHAEAVLMIGEGLSYEEAAAELGIEIGTVKSRVSRGRTALEAYFGLNIEREAA